jgi:hypothetical protein
VYEHFSVAAIAQLSASRIGYDRPMAEWNFTDSVTAARQDRLRAAPPFERIVAMVNDELRSLRVDIKRHSKDLGWRRVIFNFAVETTTADLFFNSPRGYRGKFCDGRHEGERANRHVLGALEDKLIAAFGNERDGLSGDEVRKSLTCATAKVWVNECGLPFDKWRRDLVIEINHPPWVKAAAGSRWGLGRWGVRAPERKWLEVKGAWIGKDGLLHEGKSPKERAQDIRTMGWS